MTNHFTVTWRNYGHWDISTPERGRIFRIRGGPGKYYACDDREKPHSTKEVDFKTMSMCMGWICDQLMFELIVAEGQEPKIIESWNI